MAENLGKRPSKGILKNSSSFDNQEAPRWEINATFETNQNTHKLGLGLRV